MSNDKTTKESIKKELFLENFEELSLKIEQLTDEVTQIKHKLDKKNKINRSFGLKALRNSEPLEFVRDVPGIGSPTKNYYLSFRAITEQWKGRKNDILITIRQEDKQSQKDIKALGIRMPIKDIKNIRILTREIISLLYVACQLKGIEINEFLREILQQINEEGESMVREIKNKMNFGGY
ncbi:MAG: hypothetical protein R6U96_14150 [Promethearchaeia archaeon]